MISRKDIKFIHSLSQKKIRDAESVFVVEGRKLVGEFIDAFECERLFFSQESMDAVPKCASDFAEMVSRETLERLSLQKSPQGILAVFKKRVGECVELIDVSKRELCLALDCIQDPGNLGTIIRVADWFGIRNVFAAYGSADVYSPKVVSATMGALARVQVHYVDLEMALRGVDKELVYGTYLNGECIYDAQLENSGVVVMGNEGNGISKGIEKYIGRRLFIPPFPGNVPTSESLNVAIAASIVCSEFRRRDLVN